MGLKTYYHIYVLLCKQEREDSASGKVRIIIASFFLTHFFYTSTVISLPGRKPYPVVKWSVLWAIFTLDKIIHNFLLM